LFFTACSSDSNIPVLPENNFSDAGFLSNSPSPTPAPEKTAETDTGLPDAANETDPIDLSEAAVVPGVNEGLTTVETGNTIKEGNATGKKL
jgi:hypothetical protein